jgi:GDP-L-fucose synthase
MEKKSRILIVGNDVLGRALLDYLKQDKYRNIIKIPAKLDLISQREVYLFMESRKPEYVFFTNAKSGGIGANIKYPADFIYSNLQAQANVIESAHRQGVKKLLYFGSSCTYPRESPQPIKEEYWLAGELEKTSEAYAVAKIAGIKMCQSYFQQYGVPFISVIPATVYGPADDFSLENGHVIPSLLRRFHEAKIKGEKEVVIWGSGRPCREFLYQSDLAEAAVMLMDKYEEKEIINISSGENIAIRALAFLLKDVITFKGKIVFDKTKPDGALRKFLDSSKITRLGWKPKINLRGGLEKTYWWYKRRKNA